MRDAQLKKMLLGGVAAASVLGWVSHAGAHDGVGSGTLVGTGPDYVYGASPLAAAAASVYASASHQPATQLTLVVSNVSAPAGTEFGAHVHTNPCGQDPAAAGGHFQQEDAGHDLRSREIWLDFRVDHRGVGRAVATRNWSLEDRSNRSIVVHEHGTDHGSGAAGRRLVCIDLDG